MEELKTEEIIPLWLPMRLTLEVPTQVSQEPIVVVSIAIENTSEIKEYMH